MDPKAVQRLVQKLSCMTGFANGAQFVSELRLVVSINLRFVSLQPSKQMPSISGPKTVSIHDAANVCECIAEAIYDTISHG
jgi:hypothetical protein